MRTRAGQLQKEQHDRDYVDKNAVEFFDRIYAGLEKPEFVTFGRQFWSVVRIELVLPISGPRTTKNMQIGVGD
jgi:hypothetical protein